MNISARPGYRVTATITGLTARDEPVSRLASVGRLPANHTVTARVTCEDGDPPTTVGTRVPFASAHFA